MNARSCMNNTTAISGVDPRGSLGFGDPLQTVSYSKVSTSNNYFQELYNNSTVVIKIVKLL